MPLKVFYLDDEPDLIETFTDLFSSSEVEIHCFEKPEEFITEVQKNKPDVVFLDYRLRGLTGEDVAKLIDPQLPKALITGEIIVQPSVKFEQLFAKPYDPEKIQAYLEQLLKLKMAS